MGFAKSQFTQSLCRWKPALWTEVLGPLDRLRRSMAHIVCGNTRPLKPYPQMPALCRVLKVATGQCQQQPSSGRTTARDRQTTLASPVLYNRINDFEQQPQRARDPFDRAVHGRALSKLSPYPHRAVRMQSAIRLLSADSAIKAERPFCAGDGHR